MSSQEGTAETARPGREPAAGHQPGPGRLRSFDPVRVGRLEAAAWAAYYLRQWGRLLALSLWLVHSAFGLDWLRTVHGAWLVARANQLWAPARSDPAGARRCMRRFYALLRLGHGAPDDPARAARLEVDWWAVHREHQRGADGDAEPLVAALARLYAYLYRAPESDVRPAAQLRAKAMDISDEWVAAGCPPGSPLLPAIRAELVRSYAALLTAVHH
jgi:hypothetical protein